MLFRSQIREFPAKSASSCLGLWSPKGAPQQITRTPTKKCTRPVFTSALKWCEEFPISCTRDGVSPEHCFQWVPSMHSFVAGPPCDTSVSSKNRRDRCPAPPITHPRERILGGRLRFSASALDVLFLFLVGNPLPDGAREKQVIQHRDQP